MFDTIGILPAELYRPIYILLSIVLSLFYCLKLQRENIIDNCNRVSYGPMLLYALTFIIVVGLRPINGYYFGDTANYARIYSIYQGLSYNEIIGEKEWIFTSLSWLCAQQISVQYYFLIIEVIYVGSVVWACKRFCPNNSAILLLSIMTAFSFFSYGTNGIRNGMACSLVILAISFLQNRNKYNLIFVALLAYVAFNIHNSTALPILCMLVCLFFKNTKAIILFWCASIVLSFVFGTSIETFFTSLGFDDRMESYSSENIDEQLFSAVGFRFDFLLYSAMPILLGWYIVCKRNILDLKYSYLLNCYTLCNAIWVMMIRASYSNRFAYLSWFLYPIVLAYPLLSFSVFKHNNNRKVALILFAHTSFTIVMSLI